MRFMYFLSFSFIFLMEYSLFHEFRENLQSDFLSWEKKVYVGILIYMYCYTLSTLVICLTILSINLVETWKKHL